MLGLLGDSAAAIAESRARARSRKNIWPALHISRRPHTDIRLYIYHNHVYVE